MSEMRVGDFEREQAASALGDHYAAGRLRPDEYAERLDAAWTARTRGDLAALFTDLPLLAPEPARPSPPPRAGRDGFRLPWPGVALVVLVLGGVALTHLPVLLLFLLAFVLFKVARADRRRDRMRGGWSGR